MTLLYVVTAFWAGGLIGFTVAALMAASGREDQVLVARKGGVDGD